MKPNMPSLYLQYAACTLVVVFKLLGLNWYMMYLKSALIPLIFIYYFITNNYKISFVNAMIFLLCFIGGVFDLLQFEVSLLGSLVSFFMVNLFLLKLSIDDFKSLKFEVSDRIPVFNLFLIIVGICISVVSLQYENIRFDFAIYVLFAIALGILIFVAIANYLKT